MTRQPRWQQLAKGMAHAARHVSALSTEAFRATSVAYANRDDLLTGLGAKMNGGRWNPPGSFATVYTSLTAETAVAEYLAHQRHYGFRDSDVLPCVLVGLEVHLRTVLDLTVDEVRRALGVSAARLLEGTWRKPTGRESLTQAIGRLAFAAEFEGLVVPSAAAPGTRNLVVFPGNLVPPDGYVRIVNRSRLPPPRDPKD